MANRYRRWAQRASVLLKRKLGGRCAKCGKRRWYRNLEFDCIQPVGDTHHKWETNRRICFYRLMHAEGNLQLLCRKPCHRRKTANDVYPHPF